MPIAPLRSVTLDCSDPVSLAEFYRQLAGGDVVYSSADFVYLAGNAIGLAFQRAENYRRPSWPDPTTPQQAHLDFHVDDPDLFDEVEARAVALGAAKVGESCSTQKATPFV